LWLLAHDYPLSTLIRSLSLLFLGGRHCPPVSNRRQQATDAWPVYASGNVGSTRPEGLFSDFNPAVCSLISGDHHAPPAESERLQAAKLRPSEALQNARLFFSHKHPFLNFFPHLFQAAIIAFLLIIGAFDDPISAV
jgi:hypothetical protein